MSAAFLPKPDAAPRSSAERSLAVLAVLAHEGQPMSLADLVHALGLPKGTVHRMCGQLMESGFIARDINESRFVVGPALRKLALDTLNHGSLRGLRHAVLSELVEQVGETCNFTTLDGAQVLYLDRVEAPWPWRLTLDVGAHVPLHCTASGKLFLAMMDERSREALLRTLTFEPMTEHTIVTREAMRTECAQIVARGHSFDREEFVAGLIAAAVPVRDSQGTMRAAMAIHGPTTRMTIDDVIARLPALEAAALRMGALL
jgi:IclR family transcriptional regulator, acetate operon repressor